MDFTRQPIIESIVTPKEGCKLVVRSSKGGSQEEFFVDSLEIVSFGGAFFYRSLERPKCFMVPVMDYEILEVREARMVLKNVGIDRAIKIGGGRVKVEPIAQQVDKNEPSSPQATEEETTASTRSPKIDPKSLDKKRERRRNGRRRRGKDDQPLPPDADGVLSEEANEPVPLPQPRIFDEESEPRESPPPFASILPPPSRLISETLERYREDESFRGVFLSLDKKPSPATAEEAEAEPLQELSAEQEGELIAVIDVEQEYEITVDVEQQSLQLADNQQSTDGDEQA